MSDVVDVVKAREFQLVDDDGKTRVSIGLDSAGNAQMHFLDKNEKLRIKLGSETNGPSSISVLDSDGEPRMVAMVAENGSSYLFMYDKQGVTRLQVETGSQDITTLIMGGRNKKPLVKLAVDSPDGNYEQGNVSIYDSNGKLLNKIPHAFQ